MPEVTAAKKPEDFIPAMLAKETDHPFSNKDWLYEIKWDGYRAIAEVNKKDVKLYSRNGNSFLSAYAEVVEELSKMKLNAVLDGEIVVLNEEGNPDFHKLQEYGIHKDFPLQYYVFDLLELNEKKLYAEPLIERKKLLSELIEKNAVIKYSDHIEERGEDFFAAIQQKDLEGIMAKRMDSKYFPGKRTTDWLKIKHHKSEEAIIAGFTAPRGGRKYFGALVLGTMIKGKLTYAGHTGTGFDADFLKEVFAKLQPLIRPTSPFDEKVKTNMPVTWVEPKYICEVKFSEWTSDGKLRHPVFVRMREDKEAKDINTQVINSEEENSEKISSEEKNTKKINSKKTNTKKANTKEENSEEINYKGENAWKEIPEENVSAEEKPPDSVNSEKVKKDKNATACKEVVSNEKEKIYKFGKNELKTTNRIKIFFPEEGITKGDVLDYYDRMSDLIIPYLKDRPQSLFRTPNGINQKGFFHKDAGDEAPAWVKHIPLYSDSIKKDVDYILCNDKATLLYLVNLGCIEINPWHSRVKTLDNPDYLIIDIDPSDNNTFDQVIEAANVVKGILDKAGAMSICKTSGASGLHIYIPLGKKYDYDHAKDFANLICMMANQLIPEFTTMERSLTKRSKDKIYMDYLQNRKGQTIASVYSLRPKKGATVSTPLDWGEVKKGLTPKDFTIKTIHERLKKAGDLFAPMLDSKNAVNLAQCLENLEA